MINAQSVKTRLKNHAKETNSTFQDVLTIYALERTIHRVSMSQYSSKFSLKGGILLYALFDGNFTRATADVDLHAKNVSNDIQKMNVIFSEIFQIESDDALVYDLKTLDIITITEFKQYPGVNVSIIAYLDKTKIKISIDIGFGDIVYPKLGTIKFPTILDMQQIHLQAYSIYTIIAEKFEAAVQLGYANSRYKDFYDIYILATTYEFNGEILKQAIIETFEHRKTGFSDIVAFENDFANDYDRKISWNSFIKKKKAMVDIDFESTIDLIKLFLQPAIESIITQNSFSYSWNYIEKSWQ